MQMGARGGLRSPPVTLRVLLGAMGLGRAVFALSLLWYRSVKSPRDALTNVTDVSVICFQGLYLVLSLGGVR